MERSQKAIEEIVGIVEHGDARGADLGLPTANVYEKAHSSEGVYVSQTCVQGKWFQSVTCVGGSKTFNVQESRVETHIFGFDSDLYGQEIRVQLLKKLRDNKKFSTVQELIQALEADKQHALDYFKQL